MIMLHHSRTRVQLDGGQCFTLFSLGCGKPFRQGLVFLTMTGGYKRAGYEVCKPLTQERSIPSENRSSFSINLTCLKTPSHSLSCKNAS